MTLGNEGETVPAENAGAEKKSKGFPIDLLKRDYRLWIIALLRGWIWLVSVPVVLVLCTFLYVKLAVPASYEASCALVRAELPDPRHGGMPEGYSPVQLSVIMNMMLSRANLQTTISRLNLNMSTSHLFFMLSVRQPQKNTNYIAVVARADTPELAAAIANTQAEVFVEDYKKIIADNILDIYKSLEKNLGSLHGEIEKLNNKQKELNAQHGFFAIQEELDKLSTQITNMENQAYLEETRMNSYRDQIASLQATLKQTPPEVQVYEERSTEAQTTYERAVMELSALRQRYTEENPIVQKQMENVKALERNLKKASGANLQSKVVFGKNAMYTGLQTDIVKREVELAGIESRFKKYAEHLIILKKQRSKLDVIRPEFKKISDELELKTHLLKRLEESKKSLEMFLQRSYSDIAIYEPAVPPRSPMATKKKLILLASLILGLGVTVVGLLIREGLNFKVRSRVDIEDALHLPLLGAVPELIPDKRMIYYSAVQSMICNGEKRLEKSGDKPVVVTTFSASANNDPQLLQNIFEVLDIKNIKTLHIYSIQEAKPEQSAYLVNDYLYCLTDVLPEPDDGESLYFVLDDMAFIAPPSRERVKSLCECFHGYDLILWNLFEYEQNSLLFRQLCEFSSMTILPMCFGSADKLKIYRQLKELRSHGGCEISALLYNINIKYYSLAE